MSSVPTEPPARVLLVNLNSYDQPYPVYPLGLSYIDGALRAAGHETVLWDARMAAESLEDCLARVRPEFVGLSMRNIDNVQCHNPKSFIHDLVGFCRRVRAATAAPIVLGGSGFSVFPREIFKLGGIEYGIHGAGERTFVRLIAALRAGSDEAELGAIPGLVFRRSDGAIRAVPCRAEDAEFSTSPHHDPALMRAYLAQGSLPGVQTQRGCPLRCCYCTYPLIEGKRSRFLGGEAVVAEMRRLKELGVKFVFFVDSVFNTRADHVVEICEALIRADLGVQWECFLRPRGVTRELLQLMQRAGLSHIEFGSDSFSDSVLRSYGKSFTFEEVRAASVHAHELGLRYSHFIIFGGPGETRATVEETLARARTLHGAFYFGTLGMRIYPDTPLWRQLAPESRGEAAADYLVEPRFYIAPEFTLESLHARLREYQRDNPNWIVGDPPPAFVDTMDKLRRRGVRGPMWEYAELLQRMQYA
ncbi:MAG TPA: lipid biosynthesis B12-binding/radical SAM protein [Opitutaceae bacterium]|nr:lipid biosynthesis B12-binding/radical SAM protein [Opitutaceae bacterium]